MRWLLIWTGVSGGIPELAREIDDSVVPVVGEDHCLHREHESDEKGESGWHPRRGASPFQSVSHHEARNDQNHERRCFGDGSQILRHAAGFDSSPLYEREDDDHRRRDH